MKNTISAVFILLFFMSTFMSSCSKWTETEAVSFQDHTTKPHKSEEYYANLRAYKKSDHQIMFGWFGDWYGGEGNAALAASLRGLPDSVDLVSIWSKTWWNLTQTQKEDLKYAQEVMGTRVTFTVFSHNMTNLFCGGDKIPEGIKNDRESIPAAAKALSDTIFKYGYDGIDFDHECSAKDLFYDKENMTILLREMRKNLGPDKMINVDGNLDLLTVEGASYVNYAIGQNYSSDAGSYGKLSNRFRPEQYIVTASYEQHFGNTERVLRQARWQPAEGRKGGSGIYLIHYGYRRNPEYRYVREAIQIMNPAKL